MAGPLQTAQRENEALARRYGAQGTPVPEMATEFFPVLPISDTLRDPELHFLAGSRLCFAPGFNPQAGVGTLSMAGLMNRAGTGVIAVVQRIVVRHSANLATTYSLRIEGGPLAAEDSSFAGYMRDSRWGFATRSTLEVALLDVASGAAPGTNVVSVQLPTTGAGGPLTTDLLLPEPIVLGPQSRIWVHNGANQETAVGFFWRERAIQAWELTGAI